jgi:hypothetical protein
MFGGRKFNRNSEFLRDKSDASAVPPGLAIDIAHLTDLPTQAFLCNGRTRRPILPVSRFPAALLSPFNIGALCCVPTIGSSLKKFPVPTHSESSVCDKYEIC